MNRTVMAAVGVVIWGELVHWRAARAQVCERPFARSEAVVVLGFRDTGGERANALNRWRMRAALRSIDPAMSDSILVCSGASGAGSVSEAALLARYAVAERGFTGTARLEERSRSTWQNIENVIPLIEHADQIKIVSNPLHAQKARLYLRHQRPDLAERLVRADDYRPGEAWPLKPFFALYGLRDLARCKRSLARKRRQRVAEAAHRDFTVR
ncbi:YdcF family protein [Saccharomonospora sp. NPDC006951]